MNRPKRANIALFIDADNASSKCIETALDELSKTGDVHTRKAFGNWGSCSLAGWAKTLHQHAIQPIQQFDLIKGKNATDIAMTIEIMDSLHQHDYDTYAIMTSDCDFTPLAVRLRAAGKTVIGLGKSMVAAPFTSACSQYIALDMFNSSESAAAKIEIPALNASLKSSAAEANKQAIKQPTAIEVKSNTKLMDGLRNAVSEAGGDTGWVQLSTVGIAVKNKYKIDHKALGFGKLAGLLKKTDLFSFKDEGGSPLIKRKRSVKPSLVPATQPNEDGHGTTFPLPVHQSIP